LTPTVLYMEDEEGDAFFMGRAFQQAQPPLTLRVVEDGKKALAYLAGEPPYADRRVNPLPSLILLDINVPLLSGFEVLAHIRGQRALDHIPVIIFSSSGRPDDRKRAEELGATHYLMKPNSGMQFPDVVEELRRSLLSTPLP